MNRNGQPQPYAELHCRTNYSFLSGASHPDELVERAAELGYGALAITDENSLAGVVRAYAVARTMELPLIIGAEIVLRDSPPAVLWAADRAGYANLSKLLTVGRRRAPKGECWLEWDDLAAHASGLLAGVLPTLSGDRQRTAHIDASHPSYPWYAEAAGECTRVADPLRELRRYRELFGDRGYMLAELFRGVDDELRLARLREFSRRSELPLVAGGDVLYHSPARLPLHDVLTAIKHRTTVAEAGELLQPNAERHLASIEERYRQFASIPQALWRTAEIAERCRFCLSQLRYEYPEELAPAGQKPMEYLKQLTWEGAWQRYPEGVPERVVGLLTAELQLIEELGYEAYFLTVWDLVRFARSRDILCQGRGSAANSAVCYCLGVTSVDPSVTDLLFERFISKERNEAPDIDVDFEHERREEVLQYLYDKYGRERAGLAATVITYRSRSAIRDVGKALGLSEDRVDALAKQIDGYHNAEELAPRCRAVGIDPDSDLGKRFQHLAVEILGFPRHLSQHVGGMVITHGLLHELVPIENAAMEGRTVIQWDKEDLEELGLLKVDCLCLGMLTAIRKCFDLIRKHWRCEYTLANIPADDTSVYDMICSADTVGVFQIESRGQMSMLPRLKPRCWYDLVIEVAIVRPGPIQGNMVHPYLRRRAGREPVTYPNAEIEAVLSRTLGVPIFQEQAMKLAVVAAGFTPGEADQLRRAMGAWRRTGVMEKFRDKLMSGMRERGLSDEFAEQVFRQIRGFGEYGFPESHAASFALLVYVSAWLKYYYPSAFTAGILNSMPMGFYGPAQLVADVRRHGVRVLPVDVNFSDWDHKLEGSGRLPRAVVEELAESPADRPSLCASGGMGAEAACAAMDGLARCEEANLAGRGGSSVGGAHPKQETQGAALPPIYSHYSPLPQPALRLGLRQVTGLAVAAAEKILQARERGGRFTSMSDFAKRTGIGQATVSRLSNADAFASLRQDRREALWQSLAQEVRPVEQPLLDGTECSDDDRALLPALADHEEVFADYRSLGFSLRDHPIRFYRSRLDRMNIVSAGDLAYQPNDCYLSTAGLVILRQRPSTAKGITFVTLEDETGTANLVVKQPVWERYVQIARGSPAWIAHGKLERREGVVHVVVSRLEDLSGQLRELASRSRDFR